MINNNNKMLLLQHLFMFTKPSIVLPIAKQLESRIASLDLPLRLKLSCVYLLQSDSDSADRHLKVVSSNSHLLNHEHDLFYRAIKYWAEGDMFAALDEHKKLLNQYPRNLWSLYIAYQHAIMIYDMKWFYDLMKDKIYPEFNIRDVHSDPYAMYFGHHVKSFYCFTLEEMGLLDEAEKVGVEAEQHFEKYINDPSFTIPWIHHSLCHVYHTSGRYSKGIEYMEARKHTWHSCNSFLQTHNYWHLALLYITRNATGDIKRAIQLFDQNIWIDHSADETQWNPQTDTSWKSDPAVNTGAINLLWKLDMNLPEENEYGLDSRWKEVNENIPEGFLFKHSLAYNDMNYAYSLARSYVNGYSDELIYNNYRTSLVEKANLGDSYSSVYRNLLIPLLDGILASLRGDNKEAYRQLSPIFEHTNVPYGSPEYTHNAIGGSLLQRGVLEDLWNRIQKHSSTSEP
jgi:tetratricopeptide (TPR) repeat protein